MPDKQTDDVRHTLPLWQAAGTPSRDRIGVRVRIASTTTRGIPFQYWRWAPVYSWQNMSLTGRRPWQAVGCADEHAELATKAEGAPAGCSCWPSLCGRALTCCTLPARTHSVHWRCSFTALALLAVAGGGQRGGARDAGRGGGERARGGRQAGCRLRAPAGPGLRGAPARRCTARRACAPALFSDAPLTGFFGASLVRMPLRGCGGLTGKQMRTPVQGL